MAEICKAKYRWTRDELVKAMNHHHRLKVRPWVSVMTKVFSLALLVIIALVLLAWIFLPSTSTPPFWALVLLALPSLIWLIEDRLNTWYWGRNFTKRPDSNINVEWDFSKDEIRVETDLGKSTVSWRSFLRVVETTDGFLFYPLKKLFHWIPYSAFESGDCVEKVRGFVTENAIPLIQKGQR